MKRHLVTTAVVVSSACVGLATWFANRNATGAPTAPNAPNAAASARANANPPSAPSETPAQRIQRGEHLVLTAGCNDCHTPLKMGANGPEPDMTRLLSGHPESSKLPPPPAASMPWIVAASASNTAWAGPWGVSFTANLTPDKDTGLGAWSRDEFIQTLKSGRHRGRGRPVLPPMPIPSYRNFSDDELGAIFAYLGSIPALKNRVPEPLPPAAPKAPHG